MSLSVHRLLQLRARVFGGVAGLTQRGNRTCAGHTVLEKACKAQPEHPRIPEKSVEKWSEGIDKTRFTQKLRKISKDEKQTPKSGHHSQPPATTTLEHRYYASHKH